VNIPLIWLLFALSPTLGVDHLGAAERGLRIELLVTLASLPLAAFSEWLVERGGGIRSDGGWRSRRRRIAVFQWAFHRQGHEAHRKSSTPTWRGRVL
jgi:hypothetical protein